MSEYIRDTEPQGNVIYESGSLRMVEVVGFPDIELTEEPADVPEYIPVAESFSGTINGTLTLTPEQQEAIERANEYIKAIWEVVKEILERVIEVARPMWERICEIYRDAEGHIAVEVSTFLDTLMYAANNNSKWWHLYKHSKRRRIRKKYRDKLMRQLVETLTNGAERGEQ